MRNCPVDRSVYELLTASTPELSPQRLERIQGLLELSFPGNFSGDDWAHALGGTHVVLIDGDGVIAHGALVERTLECSGSVVRVGYVEGVATAPVHRRRGHGSAIMRRIGALIQERYALGALSTGSPDFYGAIGWDRWRGPTFVDGPRGRERTPEDDDGVMILTTPRSPQLDLDGNIVCDWRAGAVW